MGDNSFHIVLSLSVGWPHGWIVGYNILVADYYFGCITQ